MLDVRATSSNDAATGAQLFVDGAPVGTVPARVEVPAGKHRIEVKKAGYNDFADTADVAEGDQRQMVIDLQQAVKKGALLVTTRSAGRRRLPRRRAQGLDAGAAERHPRRAARRSRCKKDQLVVEADRHRRRRPAAEGDGAAGAGRSGGGHRCASSASMPGAEVWIDGEMKGTVNSTIQDVPVGEHIVEVRARGYAPQTVNVHHRRRARSRWRASIWQRSRRSRRRRGCAW